MENAQMSLREPLREPVWQALQTTHAQFTLTAGKARKYPAAVAPFAALEQNSAEAVYDLLSLLEPGETTYVVGARPPKVGAAALLEPLPCLQMVYPADKPVPAAENHLKPEVVPLHWADAPAMVALTDVAFRGYFRLRTCEMGDYFGVRRNGRLIAMAGERLCLSPWREVSGVCTLPEFRGQGLATLLMHEVMRTQRGNGNQSWLFVVATNRTAIRLYRKMGFEVHAELTLHGVSSVPRH